MIKTLTFPGNDKFQFLEWSCRLGYDKIMRIRVRNKGEMIILCIQNRRNKRSGNNRTPCRRSHEFSSAIQLRRIEHGWGMFFSVSGEHEDGQPAAGTLARRPEDCWPPRNEDTYRTYTVYHYPLLVIKKKTKCPWIQTVVSNFGG